jgi:uncharacterized protein YjbJ (UPF0337 family)
LNILATRIRTREVEPLTELTEHCAQLLDVASAGFLLADPVINAEAPQANTAWGFDDWLARYPGPGRSATRVDLREVGADTVSGTDKAKNKGQQLRGKAKEAVGKVTGDKRTQNEGKGEQVKSNLKDAGEKVKDAFKR